MGAMNKRDFNSGAKIFLALSIFFLAKNIVTDAAQCNLVATLGYASRQSQLIVQIIFNTLMIGAAFTVFAKKRWGLISFLLLALIKMFATIPSGTNISYAYYLGGNMVVFLRDIGLFAIAMCFRNNGISGWTAFFASDKYINEHVTLEEETPTPIPANPSSDSTLESAEDSSQNAHVEASECSAISQHSEEIVSVVIDEPLDNSTPEEVAESPITSEQAIEVGSEETPSKIEEVGPIPMKNMKRDKKTFGKVLKKSLLIIIPASIVIGIITMYILIVTAGGYMESSTTFTDKFKEYFYLPNNTRAAEYVQKAQEAHDKDLHELSYDFITIAHKYYPNDPATLKSMCMLYFDLSYDVKNDSECETSTISYANKYLSSSPNDIEVLETKAKAQYNNGQYEEAQRTAQDILFIEENSLAYNVLSRYSFKEKEWDNLLTWSTKGVALDSTHADLRYLKAYAHKELGELKKAQAELVIATSLDPNHWLKDEFQNIKIKNQTTTTKTSSDSNGKNALSISKITIKNETHDGTVINGAGSNLYDDNTRYLAADVFYTSQEAKSLTIYVKLFANGVLQKESKSPSGYTGTVTTTAPEKGKTGTFRFSFGNDKPGFWDDGAYRYEFYLDGKKIGSKEFNVYSSFYHRYYGENRFD